MNMKKKGQKSSSLLSHLLGVGAKFKNSSNRQTNNFCSKQVNSQ